MDEVTGLYGTLRLVKRLDPNAVVASFPIDDDHVSFGRDPNCSIRLYYPSVSALHANIVFREKKAFLVVLGTNGLLVDGCQVYPSTSDSNQSPRATLNPKTIPLTNNSEIEIHKKRFIFTYPPKHPRPANPSTPQTRFNAANPTNPGTSTASRTRTLRLSMIHSAQVFSPRPSADPAVNLKVLQTPLRSSPLKLSRQSTSPVKNGVGKNLMERLCEAKDRDVDAREEDGSGDGDEEEIVLVDGDHPRVVQEEKDLVILEDVPIPVQHPTSPAFNKSTPQSARSLLNSFPPIPHYTPPPTPPITLHLPPSPAAPQPQTAQQTSPPLSQLPHIHPSSQSPRRIGQLPSKASLHKAVLIRSAQRAFMRAEAEAAETDMGAGMEVDMDVDMDVYSGGSLGGREEGDDDEEEEREVAAFAVGGVETSESDGEGEELDEEDLDVEDGGEEEKPQSKSKSVWRKSWENLVGLVRSGSVTRDEEHEEEAEKEEQRSVQGEEGDEDQDQDASSCDEDDEAQPAAPQTQTMPKTQTHVQTQAQEYSQTYRRALGGGFMTPQAAPRTRFAGAGAGRYSVDGRGAGTGLGLGMGSEREGEKEREEGAFGFGLGGARRVRLETKWKVGDIVVPVGGAEGSGEREGARTPGMGSVGRRVQLSEEERKAIQERRRSALTTPDTFFGGKAPGIGAYVSSPSKGAQGASPSPSKAGGWGSPFKGVYRGSSGGNNNTNDGNGGSNKVSKEWEGEKGDGKERKEEDTRALLEKMKETVEGMKRRRSEVPAGRGSIGVGGVARPVGGGAEGGEMDLDLDGDKEESDKENENESQNAMDINEEDDASSFPTAATAAPQTPSSTNIRGRVVIEPKTPKMDGLRGLFREKKEKKDPATPVFEGVGEMMKTPGGWGMSILEEGVEGEEEGAEKEKEEVAVKSTRRGRGTPASTSKSTTITTATRRKTPRSTAAAKTPVTEGKSNFADDEATPGNGDVLGRVAEEEDDKDKDKDGAEGVTTKGKKPATRRARSKPPVVDSDAEESTRGGGGEKVQKKARLIRGSRKVVDDIPEEPIEQPKSSRTRKAQSEESEEIVEAPSARKTKSSAARSKAAATAITTDDEGTSSKTTRRAAKAADEGASASEDSQVAAKTSRKTQMRATKTQPAAASEVEQEPAAKKTTRKGRAGTKSTDDESTGTGTGTGPKRRTRAKPVEVEDTEEDPLDSIGTPDEPPVTVTKGRRRARSRTTTAETAKEEESEEEQPATGGGTDKKNSARNGTKVSGKKAAASATPATLAMLESEDGVDKENTPSVDDEEPNVRVKKPTRAKKGAKAAAVEETNVGVEVPVTKPRPTRTTRARK